MIIRIQQWHIVRVLRTHGRVILHSPACLLCHLISLSTARVACMESIEMRLVCRIGS